MLVHYIRTALRRWRIGVGVSLLICISGLAAIQALPDEFESTARFYVDLDAILMTNLDTLGAGDASLTRTQILRRALLYKPNLERLLGGCPLMIPDLCMPRDSEQKMAQIMAGITITQQTKSLFLIAYRHGDPVEARDVLRVLLKIFIQTADRSDFRRQDMEYARRVFELQIRSYEQQLRAAEKAASRFPTPAQGHIRRRPNPSEVDSLPREIAVLDDMLRDALVEQDTVRRELNKTLPMLTPDATRLSRPGQSRLHPDARPVPCGRYSHGIADAAAR